MFDHILAPLDALQSWLFIQAVQPALYSLGLMGLAEQAFDAVAVVVYGVAELALVYLLLRPLEAWRPVEPWASRSGTRVDILYTWLNRLGVLPLIFFIALRPAHEEFDSWLRLNDIIPPNLEDFVPALAAAPLASFLVYLVILDFFEYWRHRWQHRFAWWWALHALHHSQRTMSFWTDNRNHVLDDLIGAAWFAAIGLAIGVPPAQFVTLVVLGRLVENLAHANLRLSFGAVGERLLVSPRFHRVHHSIGPGHEGPARGHNFAVLFPVWDIVFRTADFRPDFPPTGIRDQLEGVDYGEGFWRQQWLGLRRLWAALVPPASETQR